MKQTARLAMLDLTPEEEAQLQADFEQMTAFGENLARLALTPQEGGEACAQG